MLSAYLSLAKPRIMGLVVIGVLASAIVASMGNLSLQTGVLLALSGSIASAGAAFLNNYFDRDIDVIMERTKYRPLPSGKVNPTTVLIMGSVLITIAVPVALRVNYLAALFILGGALIYSILYTLWLKRQTPLNIVIGGLSGSCAILAGWFAVTSAISLVPILIAMMVFLWTPSHFWSFAIVHQDSYRKASIPMLPVLAGTTKTINRILLSTGLMITVSLLIYLVGPFHILYLVSAALLGTLFLTTNIMMLRHQTERLAWLNFKISGVYLLGLFLGMVLDIVVS